MIALCFVSICGVTSSPLLFVFLENVNVESNEAAMINADASAK
jgi:hypothetical protein